MGSTCGVRLLLLWWCLPLVCKTMSRKADSDDCVTNSLRQIMLLLCLLLVQAFQESSGGACV